MDRAKIQPIVDSVTHELVALEVLSPYPVPLHDPAAMIEVDLAALRHAALLRQKLGIRVHSNIEYSTILEAWEEVIPFAPSGVVLELVERRAALERERAVAKVLASMREWRKDGGLIAFDDVPMRDGKLMSMIGMVRPDIVKVESLRGIAVLRALSGGATIVVERIETRQQAEQATAAGADELQGFYFDRVHAIPTTNCGALSE
jgi:EAL domain-containing protein (putative c-di-GMP-specific phosphodiesterase class I)